MKNGFARRALAVLCVCVLLGAQGALAAEVPQVVIDAGDLSVDETLSADVHNVAVMICDPEGENVYGPTNTMMIASVNIVTGDARMVVLEAALVADIPVAGSMPMREAYALGGENLAMKMLNGTFGLNITQFICVDLRKLSDVVETVGGLQATLDAEDAAVLGLPAGEIVTLDADKALAYMRLPDPGNVKNRQYEAVMQALYQATRDRETKTLATNLQKVTRSVRTNMTAMDFMRMAGAVFSSNVRLSIELPQMEELTVVSEDPLTYSADMEAVKAKLHTFLYAQ